METRFQPVPVTTRNRRAALLFLFGVAVAPLAVQKIGSSIGSLISGYPLMTPVEPPRIVGAFQFSNEAGAARTLADSRGRHLLLNIWATWCPPCKEEMPSLDRLKPLLARSTDIEVIALSVDRASVKQVRSFYSWNEIRNLDLYHGDEGEVLSALGIRGLPTTLVLDHAGLEVGRLIGPTKWDSDAIIAQLAGMSTKTARHEAGKV